MNDHSSHHGHSGHGGRDDHGGHGGHGSHGGLVVERRARYKGQDILIRTRYEIEVSGKPFEGHITVGEDGLLTTHAIPYIAFSSAMGLMKAIIDLYHRGD